MAGGCDDALPLLLQSPREKVFGGSKVEHIRTQSKIGSQTAEKDHTTG